MGVSGTLRVEDDSAGAAGVGPVVLLDGRPWAEAWVRRLRASGSVDEREAELVLRRESGAVDRRERDRLWEASGRAVVVAQPTAVAGGASRLVPLLRGRLEAVTDRLDERRDEVSVRVACDWSRLLGRVVRREDLASDERWTVAALIERLNAVTGLAVSVDLLETRQRLAVVPAGVLSGSRVGQLLGAVCGAFGLVVRRRLTWQGQGVRETRELCSERRGRRVRLRRGGVSARVTQPRPTRVIAEAAGEVVESTFVLQPGWGETSLELDDAAYGKSTSDDFDAVANAFRLWVLNEDGAFGGERFDVRALFEEERPLPLESLRFGNALTRDAAGRRLPAVVEVSVDDGQSWSRYGGAVVMLDDRAGVYFEDDALDGAWLTAVRQGVARVRVTATLRSPLPIRMLRWRGNAFAGGFATRRHWLGRTFEHRRVHAGSKYHAAVRAGERSADEADERPAMADWLRQQAERERVERTRVQLRTAGVMTVVSVGDRVTHIGGRRVGDRGRGGAAGHDAAGLIVSGVEHKWDEQVSELTLEAEA